MKTTYVNDQDPVRGVVFTLDGQTYANIETNYKRSDRHATLHITNHSDIIKICEAIVSNGELFTYSRKQ